MFGTIHVLIGSLDCYLTCACKMPSVFGLDSFKHLSSSNIPTPACSLGKNNAASMPKVILGRVTSCVCQQGAYYDEK